MTSFERVLSVVCGTGLAYILLSNFVNGEMSPEVYQNSWALAAVFGLSLQGVVMAMVAVYDFLRKQR